MRPKTKPTFSDAELAIQALLRLASEARGDLSKFYGIVMRHETTKQRLEPAPHQQVMFSFVQHHDRCVFRQPIGTAKTFGMAAVTMWLLGNDVTQRGVILSKTQGQASKVLNMVADYITEPALNKSLALVFPHLRKSTKPNDPWTRNLLTVQRPPAIRDASLSAVGLGGSIQGSRVSWLVADDTLDTDNTRTRESRDVARDDFEGKALSRLDFRDSRAVFTNTPWDREDLTYYLEKEVGWPTCTMDIYGNLTFTNVDAVWLAEAQTQGLIRPSAIRKDVWRLAAHDPDPDETIPLWPERLTLHEIENIRTRMVPHQFARMYLCEPFDAESQRCQKDWVERCKLAGMGLTLEREYTGSNPTYIGLDLGIGNKGQHDLTVFFVFEVQPDGKRRVLWVQSGRWSGPEIVEKLIGLHDRYHATIAVENNQAQDYIRQFALKTRADLMIWPHTTHARNKTAEDFGVESIFTELQNGAWIIPCEYGSGKCDPEVQKWIDDMLFYQPTKHTGDHLMACWIGRERARRYGHRDPQFQSKAKSEWVRQSRTSGF